MACPGRSSFILKAEGRQFDPAPDHYEVFTFRQCPCSHLALTAWRRPGMILCVAGVRAWCGWLAWMRACRTAVVTVPGENRLVSSSARPGRLGRGGEAGEGFAAVLACSGREPGGGAAGVVLLAGGECGEDALVADGQQAGQP